MAMVVAVVAAVWVSVVAGKVEAMAVAVQVLVTVVAAMAELTEAVAM